LFVFGVFSALLLSISQLPGEEHSLVFVHIGKDLPSHIKHSIAQARLFNPDSPMFLLANEEALSKDQVYLDITTIAIESLKRSKNHKKYGVKAKTSGFWRYTLERFLVLDDFIQQYEKSDVFHIENDVMIYFNLKSKLEVFRDKYSNMVATVFDCDERSVPSFVYVATPEASSKLSEFIAARAHVDTTDMETLSLFKDANYGSRGHLPILIPTYADDYPMTNIFKQTAKDSRPFHNCLDHLQMIFDAAALGQFLGGIDPILGHSKAGFLGEASVFLPMYFRFSWEKDDEGRWIPYISYKDVKYPIANLHIHSKALGRFSSVNDVMPELPSVSFSSLPFNHIQPKNFR
jgi:hypothetical protein